jgi:GNAT superfamily N-acetyltransferase
MKEQKHNRPQQTLVPIEIHRGEYTISTDQTRLNITLVHKYLSQDSYWGLGRTLESVQRSIQNSLCFGVYQGEQQVGFARVVTDYATFSWLCDVFILESHRDRGLGKWLVATIVEHPDLQSAQQFLLATRDAHELYRQYGGFEDLPMPEKWMVRRKTVIYQA